MSTFLIGTHVLNKRTRSRGKVLGYTRKRNGSVHTYLVQTFKGYHVQWSPSETFPIDGNMVQGQNNGGIINVFISKVGGDRETRKYQLDAWKNISESDENYFGREIFHGTIRQAKIHASNLAHRLKLETGSSKAYIVYKNIHESA